MISTNGKNAKKKDLNEMEKTIIENKAKELLDKYNVNSIVGVDVVKLATDMGFIVGTTSLNDNEDGFVLINETEKSLLGLNSNKIIGINEKRSPKEKMFIIAHELGHYCLRDEANAAIFAHREQKKGKDELEQDVDYFAACLLMPPDSFIKRYKSLESVYENNKNGLVKELSNIFCVPVDAVERRIEETGAINKNG